MPGKMFPEAPDRPGAVILARHGEPALSRKVRLDSAGYRRWWAVYEESSLLAGQEAPESLKAMARRAGFVIASIRPRSVETAQAVAEDRAFAEDPLFVEAPLPPPRFPAWVKFSPRTWGVISRAWWWFFDHHEGQETRAEAEVRAKEAAKLLADLASSGHDVLVLAHGFFNGMVGEALKRSGWRCVKSGGFKYWAARRFERT